jgi:hypothetical protein
MPRQGIVALFVQPEVPVHFIKQLIIGGDPGENRLRVSGLHQHIPERVVHST